MVGTYPFWCPFNAEWIIGVSMLQVSHYFPSKKKELITKINALHDLLAFLKQFLA